MIRFRALLFVLLPAAALFAAPCPPDSHHQGKDAEGRRICIANGEMTCPDRFTQMLVHGRFHCVSHGIVAQNKKCFEGQKLKLDNGQIRCEMPEYDKCNEPGFRVLRLPGGKYACAREEK
jgi:hypothetical protein